MRFAADPGRSNRATTTFSKPLTPNWDISFLLQRLDWWGSAAVIDVALAVIPRGVKARPKNTQAGDFLFLEYWKILPFFDAYKRFSSLGELEVNVKAYLVLYELVSNYLERRLTQLLPENL